MVPPVKMDLPVLLDPLDFPDPLVPPEIRERLDLLELLDLLVPVEPLYVKHITGTQAHWMTTFNSFHLLFLRVSAVRPDQPDPLDLPDPLYVTAS